MWWVDWPSLKAFKPRSIYTPVIPWATTTTTTTTKTTTTTTTTTMRAGGVNDVNILAMIM